MIRQRLQKVQYKTLSDRNTCTTNQDRFKFLPKNYDYLDLMDFVSKVVLLIGMSVWAGYLLGLYLSNKKRLAQRMRLNEEFAIARASLQQLKGQLDVLCQHSMEYFHTLFDAELPLLKEMASAVEAAIEHAETLRNQGELNNHYSAYDGCSAHPYHVPAKFILAINRFKQSVAGALVVSRC